MGKFAVIGLGFFGDLLARALAQQGHEVVAIDNHMEPVEEIKDHVSYAVRLDSTDERAMRAQGLAEMDAVVVTIGEDFESSVYTTILLQQLGVRRIITRTTSPAHTRIIQLLGVSETIFPEQETAHAIAKTLTFPGVKEYIPLGGDYMIADIPAPASAAGKTVKEANFREAYGLNLVTIRRPGKGNEGETVLGVPTPETVIRAGDTLLLMGREKDLKRLL